MAEAQAERMQTKEKVDSDKMTVEFDIGHIANMSLSSEEEERVLRKIDKIILPLMAFTYMLQFMDKVALSYSSLLGIITDTHLVGSQYSWTSSIFYFGYLIWSYPTSYLVVRFPLGPYLAVTVALWGAVLMCHAASTSFAGLMCARFFLGVTEAAVTPGFALIVGMFYTRKEQPIRQNAWSAGNGVANIISGVVAYGIGNIKNSPLATWRILFLILGGITTAWSLVLMFILPASPAKARFLNTREREAAIQRTLANKTGTMDERTYNRSQVLEALKDPQTWLMCAYMLAIHIPNGALTSFLSLVISGFGFGTLETLLLQMPSGGIQLLCIGYTCLHTYFFHNSRLTLMLSWTLLSLLGSLLIYSLSNDQRIGRLVGCYFSAALAANIPLVLSLVSANIAGFTKKTTVSAMLFIAYSVGNIIGPQFFLSTEAPRYETGLRGVIAGLSFAAFFIILLYIYYIYENNRRDRINGAAENVPEDAELSEEMCNLTDREMAGFRYVL